MWKTFAAEFKFIFSKRRRAVEWFVMLFIPFVYGFLYMNAYWTPFKHVDKLPVVVLNLDDKTGISGEIVKDIQDRKLNAGNMIIEVKVKSVDDIYSKNTDAEAEIQKEVNKGKYSAAIVIPKGFNQMIEDIKGTVNVQKIAADHLLNGKIDIIGLIEGFKNEYELKNNTEHHIQYYNDYKNNYLAGEMTNFGAGLNDLFLRQVLTTIKLTGKSGIIKTAWSYAEPLIHSLTDKLSIVEHAPPNTRLENEKDNFGYGLGLSPYFISIALWAGMLVMTFMVKNERHIKDQSTLKHYFGKWAVWVVSGIIQATILMTAVTLQGVDIGIDQWQMFFLAYLTVIIFATIVQGVAFSIRYGDIGEFTVVILLVLQLISSSGTFPVDMQWILFKIVHPIAPFTYTVNAFRELLFEPDVGAVFANIGWLLLFPAVVVPISVFLNYRFDKKTVKKTRKGLQYQSFEIHMGDM